MTKLKLQAPTILQVENLSIDLPDGSNLIEDLSLSVKSGEVVVVLGGSGNGKLTFLKILLEREGLEREGFRVEVGRLKFQRDELGLVPPHGSSDSEECRAIGASVGVCGTSADIGRRVGDFYPAYPQNRTIGEHQRHRLPPAVLFGGWRLDK